MGWTKNSVWITFFRCLVLTYALFCDVTLFTCWEKMKMICFLWISKIVWNDRLMDPKKKPNEWQCRKLNFFRLFLQQPSQLTTEINAVRFSFSIYFVFNSQSATPRWEPQIATLCEAGQQYHPQHLSEDGRWTTDLSIKTPATTCLRDKMDLLEHCKKVSKTLDWNLFATNGNEKNNVYANQYVLSIKIKAKQKYWRKLTQIG